jgi:hypothetical protein
MLAAPTGHGDAAAPSPGRSRGSGSTAAAKPRSTRRRRKPDPAPAPATSDTRATARQSQLAALGIGDPGQAPLEDLIKQEEEKPRAEPAPKREMVETSIEIQAWWHRCPQCGIALIDGVRYCRSCGRLQPASKPKVPGVDSPEGLLAKTPSVAVKAPQPADDHDEGSDAT